MAIGPCSKLIRSSTVSALSSSAARASGESLAVGPWAFGGRGGLGGHGEREDGEARGE